MPRELRFSHGRASGFLLPLGGKIFFTTLEVFAVPFYVR